MKSEKVTGAGPAASKRWYDDACGTALALELLGERWALLVVREMAYGPRRFGELRANLPGISANVLIQRLEGLERAGIVRRERLGSPANVQVYGLTPWGLEATPAIRALGQWAARSPDHDPTLFLSAASLMMSFETMYDPALAGDDPVAIGFRLGRDSFLVRADGELRVTRGPLDGADVAITAATGPIAGVVYGKQPLDGMIAVGAIRVEGDADAFRRFADRFALPPKVGDEIAGGSPTV